MEVFKVEFDYCRGDSKEITRERMLWSGCWITVAEAAIRHAEEYEKELMSIEKVMPIVQQLEQGKHYYSDEPQATEPDHQAPEAATVGAEGQGTSQGD